MKSDDFSRKDFLVTLVLGIFGILPIMSCMPGLHRIYCGKVKSGCAIAIISFIPNMWVKIVLYKIIMAFLEHALILVDGTTYYKFNIYNSYYSMAATNLINDGNNFNFLRIARQIFQDCQGNIFFYWHLVMMIIVIVDLVLLSLGRFRDSNGKVVFKIRIFANIKRNIAKNKKI